MFSYLKGTLISSTPSQIILETNGIGYAISIPCSLFGKLPLPGSPLHIHTSFIVREFSHSLYGFLEIQERELFEMLLNISGVGPKLALSIIGHLDQTELKYAVNEGELKTLCKVPGVGKKTAERLIVELKDKLKEFFPQSPSDLSISLPHSFAGIAQDAVMALINLGYTQNMAQKAVKHTLSQVDEKPDLAQLITSSLKNI